jgi:hypothetical protein
MSEISGYRAAAGVVDRAGETNEKFILVYNESGSSIPNGSVVFVSMIPSTTAGYYPQTATPATTAVQQVIGVVNNIQLDKTAIAASAWGYVQVRGYCPKVLMTASIAAKVFLQAANGTYTSVSDGAALTADSFAITITTDAVAAAGYTDCMILGRDATIG